MDDDLTKRKMKYHKEKEVIGRTGERIFYDYKKKTVPDLKHSKNKYDVIDFYSKSNKTCYEIKNIRNKETPVVSLGLNKLQDFYDIWHKKRGFKKLIVVYIFEGKFMFGKVFKIDLIKKILKKDYYKTYKGGKKVRDEIFIYDGILTQKLKKDGDKKHIQINTKYIKLLKGQRKEFKEYFSSETDYSKRDYDARIMLNSFFS